MSNTFKKFMAALTSLFMALALVPATALAATGDITVNGAINNATYSAYKVFDATYSGNAVSYTIPNGSDIAKVDGFSTIFTTSENGGVTYVQRAANVTDTQIIDWLTSHDNQIATGTAAASVENTTGAKSVTLSTGSAGYYYIKSTVGDKSAVTIDTAHPEATVNSKIQETPDYPEDAKTVSTDGQTYVKVNTMEPGQTAQFRLKFNATNNAVDANGNSTVITTYTVDDTIDGFTISVAQLNALTVKVGNTTLTRNVSETAPYYSVTPTTNGFQLVIHNYDKGSFASPSLVQIDYSATLSNKNIVGESTNKFTTKYNDTTIPDTPETDTYNYKVLIDKYQTGSETTKLSGAKFVLRKGTGDSATYYKYADGVVTWVSSQSQANEVTTDENGAANFQGLEAGTYYLVETEAPAGYNLLTEAQEVTITAPTSKIEATENATVEAQLTQTAKVANNTGSELPSTGGMGTVAFTVVGAALVIGAGVALVTRRRMQE